MKNITYFFTSENTKKIKEDFTTHPYQIYHSAIPENPGLPAFHITL